MNNRFLVYYTIVIALLLPVTYLLSFVLGTMSTEVTNLMSIEGLRWTLANLENSIASCTIYTKVILICVTCDLLVESRFVETLLAFLLYKKNTSIRQQRAMNVAQCFIVVYCLIIATLILLPHSQLLSIEGTIDGSVLEIGAFPLLCFGLSITGIIFGVFSSRWSNLMEFARSSTRTLSNNSFYWVTYCLLAHLTALLYHSQILYYFGINNLGFRAIVWILFLVPIGHAIVKRG